MIVNRCIKLRFIEVSELLKIRDAIHISLAQVIEGRREGIAINLFERSWGKIYLKRNQENVRLSFL